MLRHHDHDQEERIQDELTRDARPGDRFQLAVLGINGPISASPRNYIWIRSSPLVAPDGAVLLSAANTIYRWRDGVVSVFRPKSGGTLSYSGDGLLVIAEHERGRTIRVNPHGDVTVLGDAPSEPQPFDGRLPAELPEPATGAARASDTLYVTTSTSLYRIHLKEE